MSFILRRNGVQEAVAGQWNPVLFGERTGTSFPREVEQSYTWANDGYTLGWEADPEPTPPTADQIKARLASAVQEHLDTTAQLAGYDNIVSACSYAGAPNPFQTEGQSFIVWRGKVWEKCFSVMTEVETGQRRVPSESELISLLPTR